MSAKGVIAGLCGLALVAACRPHPPPDPTAQLDRESTCTRSDSGVNVGQDVRRGPRYRVDSSGRVETLPPTPAVASDTGRHGCPAVPDSARPDSSGHSAP